MIHKRISGCVVTRNDERSIVTCLESLERVCDEVVVIDAFSTDGTRERARGCGARVIEHDFHESRAQRRCAVTAAVNNWVLWLNADEYLSRELAEEIVRVNLHGLDVCSAYELPLCANYSADPLQCGDLRADLQIRLFDRRRAAFGSDALQPRVIAHGPIGRFRNVALRGEPRQPASTQGREQRTPWRHFRAYVARQGFPGLRTLDGAPERR